MEISVQFNAKLPVKITKRIKWVLASCPILDVHSQGENEKIARKNLVEALTLFFISCFKRGTLDGVLKQCGFKAVRGAAVKRERTVAPDEDYIKVPIPFLVQRNAETECQA